MKIHTTHKERSVYQSEGSIVGVEDSPFSISSQKSWFHLAQTNTTYLAIQTKFDLIVLTMKLYYLSISWSEFFEFTNLFS